MKKEDTSKNGTEVDNALAVELPKDLMKFLEQLFEAHVNGIATIDVADVPDLEFKVILKGARWEGVVNRDIANFVINADKELRDTLISLGIDQELIDDRDLISLKVVPGSSELVESLTKLFKSAKTMKPKQAILLTACALAVLGLYKADDILGELNSNELAKIEGAQEVEKERIRYDTIKEISAAREVVEERAFENEKPIRTLVSKLDKGDTIKIGDSEPMKKDEVKKRLVKATRFKTELFYIDAPFDIEELKTPENKEWSVVLKYGAETRIPAILELDAIQLEKITQLYSPALKAKKAVTVNLLVNAQLSERGISGKPRIVGIGKARDSAVSLGKALEQVKEVTED